MDLLQVILSTIGSIVALFFLTKMIGYRQVSQMSMFDYINGITIGSIAAEMATALGKDMWNPLIAMLIYAIVGTLLSIISNKSIKLSRFIEGKPIILYDNGQIYFNHLKKAKLDIGELLMLCRVSGYFDLSELQTIILEDNGHVSILPLAEHRPLKPIDMHIKPTAEHLVANVVLDGNIMIENLKGIGKNEAWLLQQLKKHDINDVKDVFLATCDCNQKFCVYKKVNTKIQHNFLE
jgi:uncharacterized membrane protein YcaP (DUF421 family)